MTQNTLIKVESLSRDYGPNRVVNNLNFEVKRGEVLGFLGPNGAGKSTTMRMITGNLAPSTGSIRINDLDILEQPKLAKQYIGYLPEQPPLYRELTVDEFLDFCARLNRIPGPQQKQAIESAKQRCGLSQVGGRLIANLSKGYQQRVGIAQAIIHSPEVVILDEPTVGLDPIQIREIRQLIRDLGGEHSVILSTHILPEVQATCDRVQIIHQGQLVLTDSIEALTQQVSSNSLLLRVAKHIEPGQLTALASVSGVDVLENGSLRIHHDADRNPSAELAELVVKNGWGLLELTPERRSLEQIFVDITSREQDPVSANPAENVMR